MKKNKLLCAAISLCLALLFILSLTSCVYSDEIIPCIDVLNALTAIEIGLPAGKIYSATAREGEEGYISDSLLASLFGGGEKITLFEGWLDYAFFLPSGNHPCEIVVILCDTPTTAKDTARLLSRRLNTLRSANKASANAERTQYLENAAVMINRNYVLLIISSDTETLKKKAFVATGSFIKISRPSDTATA